MERLKICVTGADGFIGKNLISHLSLLKNVEIRKIVRDTSDNMYAKLLDDIDIVYHLAGVNRPDREEAFVEDNVDFTMRLLEAINFSKPVKLIVTSSTQVDLDNPYGRSKLASEKYIQKFAESNPLAATIYRLTGVFGKWCRPNYNSVVATFCYNIANALPIQIHDPSHPIRLVYIDDVVNELLSFVNAGSEENGCRYAAIPIEFNTTIGKLAEHIQSFVENRTTFFIPSIGNLFIKNLYSTFLSYLPRDKFSYQLCLKADNRGDLFEWLKSPDFGQVFVSVTKPGVIRGNHYHHTKTEKFLVIKGIGEIRFRKIDEQEIIIYRVNGEHPTVVDIPPGYTHSITNIDDSDMITLFWANEIFNPLKPDTYFLDVI